MRSASPLTCTQRQRRREQHTREARGHGEALVVAAPPAKARCALASGAPARRYSSPSGLHVTIRCAQFSMCCSASSSAATLSGLLPERAKCTMSVGTRDASALPGLVTMSVVAMASARSPRRANAPARGTCRCRRRGAGAGQHHAQRRNRPSSEPTNAARPRIGMPSRCAICGHSVRLLRDLARRPRAPRPRPSAAALSPRRSLVSFTASAHVNAARTDPARRCGRRRCSRAGAAIAAADRSGRAPKAGAGCR